MFEPIKLARITEYTDSKYDLKVVYEVDCIVDHIIKSLLIMKGTYIWNPELGSDLLKYLFDPLDEVTVNNIKLEIERVCKSHPSVEDVKTEVFYTIGNNILTVNIELIISGQNRTITFNVDRNGRTLEII